MTNIHVWSYKRCGELRTETREGDCATYLNLSGLKRAKENLLEDPSGEKSANETEIGEDLGGREWREERGGEEGRTSTLRLLFER